MDMRRLLGPTSEAHTDASTMFTGPQERMDALREARLQAVLAMEPGQRAYHEAQQIRLDAASGAVGE